MPRKPHSKSRTGCLQCKRRHIKCDEKRPTCEKCRLSVRECQFVATNLAARASSVGSPTQTAIPPSLGATVPGSYQVETSPPVVGLHIELFYHFSTDTIRTLEASSGGAILPLSMIVSHSVSTPYLMNEVLAFAALHLSFVRLKQGEYYHHHAMQLQTHSLKYFNSNQKDIDARNCIPVFLFSSILGVHMLCETLRFYRDDLSSFLAKFVQYASLHRGVRTIAGKSWATLEQVHLDNSWYNESHSASGPRVCRVGTDLLGKIQAAKLGPTLTGHYQRAIEALPLGAQGVDGSASLVPWTSIVAWPVHIPVEYLDHLALGRPEALVILAYYAVLLHYHRHFWVFGDSGKFLLKTISDHLGPAWESWLAWPRDAINGMST